VRGAILAVETKKGKQPPPPQEPPMKDVNEIDPYVRWNQKAAGYDPVMWQHEIIPYSLSHDGDNDYFTVPASTAQPANIPFTLQHTSLGGLDRGLGNPLLIDRATFADATDLAAAANWTVFLKDMGDQTQFMNKPIHVRAFAGTAQLPGKFFEPLFLPSRHVLLLTPQKISGGARVCKLTFWGALHLCWSQTLAQYPVDREILHTLVRKYLERRKTVFPFWLTTETVPECAVNQSTEAEMLIGDDGHFEASHIIYIADGDWEFEIFNPITKQTMMNGKVQCSGAIGTSAQYPQKLPVPWLIPAGQRLRIKATCLSGGATDKLYLVFRGRKIRAPLKNAKEAVKDTAVKAPAAQPVATGE
jgi:hypothetical protein